MWKDMDPFLLSQEEFEGLLSRHGNDEDVVHLREEYEALKQEAKEARHQAYKLEVRLGEAEERLKEELIAMAIAASGLGESE